MDPIQLAQDLIRLESVTTGSNRACADLLRRMLLDRGFEVICHSYRDVYGSDKVSISAIRSGSASQDSGLAFLAHSDVVSVDGWRTTNGSGPFEAFVDSEKLWGRGACDMKGPIACALAAIDQVRPEQQKSPIYFFVTGDEECGMVGAQLLVQQCPIYRRMVQSQSVGIITEPTELRVVNSHKGGCQFTVTAHGIAAHSSTSEGLNANWQLIPWLTYLHEVKQRIEVDPALRNEAFDPPTLSMNVVLKNQPTAYNITVGLASCCVFLRTMPQTAWQALVDELTARAREMELEVGAVAVLYPVHTPAQQPIVQTALKVCSQASPDTVSYATDGCRFCDLADLIVLGPGNIAQAHRCDEWIELQQLRKGTEVYRQLIQHYVG